MSTSEMLESIRGSFAIEDMHMTEEDEKRVSGILEGSISVEQAIEELNKKYGVAQAV